MSLYPSVCPSVTHRYSVETVIRIIKLSYTILVFHYQTVWQHSDSLTGTPLTGASNARDMKQSRFSTNIRFISEMIQDTMEGELEIVPKLSNGAVFNNLQ